MGYKKYVRCKICKKIYKMGNVPENCKSCGSKLKTFSIVFGWVAIHGETVIAKRKFPFGYDVKEGD
jgi:primosomal protein N'